MIDPESIGVLKEIKLGNHDGNLGELFYLRPARRNSTLGSWCHVTRQHIYDNWNRVSTFKCMHYVHHIRLGLTLQSIKISKQWYTKFRPSNTKHHVAVSSRFRSFYYAVLPEAIVQLKVGSWLHNSEIHLCSYFLFIFCIWIQITYDEIWTVLVKTKSYSNSYTILSNIDTADY